MTQTIVKNAWRNKIAIFLVAMSEPRTLKELATITKMRQDNVSSWVRVFQAHKLCYISEWRKDGRERWRTAVYSWGYGEDVPKPTPKYVTDALAKGHKPENRKRKPREKKENPGKLVKYVDEVPVYEKTVQAAPSIFAAPINIKVLTGIR